MNPPHLRVVLDTNILLSACLKPHGNEARVVALAQSGAIIACISPAIEAEYRDVLFRPKFTQLHDAAEYLLSALQPHLFRVGAGLAPMMSSTDIVGNDFHRLERDLVMRIEKVIRRTILGPRLGRAGRCCMVSLVLFTPNCLAPFGHTSDESLERFFRQHQPQFEALLVEVQADARLTTIQRKTLIYGGRTVHIDGGDLSKVESLGMPRDRWMHYQKDLQDLKLYGVMKGPSGVEFRVDPGTLFNGDSYKGFEYRRTKPVNLRHNLDGYTPSATEREEFRVWAASKPIAKNWYLYIVVND